MEREKEEGEKSRKSNAQVKESNQPNQIHMLTVASSCCVVLRHIANTSSESKIQSHSFPFTQVGVFFL